MDIFNLNKYQTPITEELKKSLPKEVWEDLLEVLETVQFVKNLTAPESIRGYAKDRPRDSKGRIIVDVTNPHLIEDMDFFREKALFHEKNKCYTFLRSNPNPKSEYASFWREELRRWKDGLVRPSDGEWIPGFYYFYLNYCPIWLNEIVEDNGIKKKAIRLRKFPKPWLGDYLWFHYYQQARDSGSHVKMLKTRGIGASFKFAATSPCNMYVERGLPNFHLASDKSFLEGDKGVFGKILDNLDWIASETPFPRMRMINKISDMQVQLGYMDEYGRRKGLKSSVFGISLKDNPDKARGVRGPLIHYEEDGLFKNLEKAWNVNRKAVEDGSNVYGVLAAAGTGGTVGADFEGSEKLFRNPLAYNIYGIPNVFDKNSDGKVVCGFFWPCYLNRANCYDEDIGESNVIKALIEVLQDRFLVKYSSSDPMAITQKKAEEPITPAEAVMRTEGTLFPVSDLKEYHADITMLGIKFYQSHYVGDLIISGDEIKWESTDKTPLRSYQTSGNVEGAIEIFELPKKGSDGKPIRGRYILGADPIDDDTGTSLASIFVLDLFTDMLVAEYTGRPKFANDYYETCRRLTLFYNGELLYENNKKGLFTYFQQKGAISLLSPNPQMLKDQHMIKGGNYGNKAVGFHATKEINVYARRLQRDWMLTLAHPSYQEMDEEGNLTTSKLNLQFIRSIAYLEEAIAWNADGNFDRVSAVGALMLLREEKKQFLDNIKSENSNSTSLAVDNYFTENYTDYFSYSESAEN